MEKKTRYFKNVLSESTSANIAYVEFNGIWGVKHFKDGTTRDFLGNPDAYAESSFYEEVKEKPDGN